MHIYLYRQHSMKVCFICLGMIDLTGEYNDDQIQYCLLSQSNLDILNSRFQLQFTPQQLDKLRFQYRKTSLHSLSLFNQNNFCLRSVEKKTGLSMRKVITKIFAIKILKICTKVKSILMMSQESNIFPFQKIKQLSKEILNHNNIAFITKQHPSFWNYLVNLHEIIQLDETDRKNYIDLYQDLIQISKIILQNVIKAPLLNQNYEIIELQEQKMQLFHINQIRVFNEQKIMDETQHKNTQYVPFCLDNINLNSDYLQALIRHAINHSIDKNRLIMKNCEQIDSSIEKNIIEQLRKLKSSSKNFKKRFSQMMNSISSKEKLIIIQILVSFTKDFYAQKILKSATIIKKFERIRDSRYFSFYLLKHLEENNIKCSHISEYFVNNKGINERQSYDPRQINEILATKILRIFTKQIKQAYFDNARNLTYSLLNVDKVQVNNIIDKLQINGTYHQFQLQLKNLSPQSKSLLQLFITYLEGPFQNFIFLKSKSFSNISSTDLQLIMTSQKLLKKHKQQMKLYKEHIPKKKTASKTKRQSKFSNYQRIDKNKEANREQIMLQISVEKQEKEKEQNNPEVNLQEMDAIVQQSQQQSSESYLNIKQGRQLQPKTILSSCIADKSCFKRFLIKDQQQKDLMKTIQATTIKYFLQQFAIELNQNYKTLKKDYQYNKAQYNWLCSRKNQFTTLQSLIHQLDTKYFYPIKIQILKEFLHFLTYRNEYYEGLQRVQRAKYEYFITKGKEMMFLIKSTIQSAIKCKAIYRRPLKEKRKRQKEQQSKNQQRQKLEVQKEGNKSGKTIGNQQLNDDKF